MQIKKVLVTGGAGYVGSVLVPKLLKADFEVTVLDLYLYGDTLAAVKNDPKLHEIKGDLRDKKVVHDALQNIDAVIHLACISNDPSFELNPNLGKSINYDASIQLFDLAKQIGVKRFIYASSSSVYGVKEEEKVTENLSLEPLTDYSRYKALCERYLLPLNSDDFTVLVLRPATVCGYSPRLRLDLTVNILTCHAIEKGVITVFGGEQARPNIHIEDMTDLYVQTLSFPKEQIAGKVYNAGYENYPLNEIAAMTKKIVGEHVTITKQDTADKRSYRVDSSKIKQELNFSAKRTVEDAIEDLVNAFKGNLIPEALSNPRYYNIKTMQKYILKNENR
ncbi:MAG: SDR family oxidoreductase [bacterium]|nr:SDR family oxidoreductase [bacterium]